MDYIHLDFDQARAMHLQFKSRLRSILYGIETNADPVLSHYECGVGKWIYEHALVAYKDIPDMVELEKVHADIHVTARELIDLYREGKIDEARAGLSKMEGIASRLVALLDKVEQQIKRQGLPSETTDDDSILEKNLLLFEDIQKNNYQLEKRIQEQTVELQRYKERFELASRATHDVIWDWDLRTDLIWWSNSYYESFGHVRTENTSTIATWYDFIHPEQKEKVANGIKAVIATGGRQWTDEYRFRKGDGSYAHVLDRGYCLYTEEGIPYRMVGSMTDITQRKLDVEKLSASQQELKEKNRILEVLNDLGKTISSDLELNKIVQAVTDAATELSGAKFGAFFYNVYKSNGEAFLLYTLSGADKSEFERFGMPRNTKVFGPTFAGEGVVRVDDIKKDPRYGHNAPHKGMPVGHLPVSSYLSVPVISRSGEVLGGLFFGHPEPGVFTEKIEDIIVNMAAQAATAMDNARLFEATQAAKEKLSSINEELKTKNDELQRINVDLDNFIYTASHDLKAPVSNIEGLVYDIQGTLQEEKVDLEELNLLVSMIEKSIVKFKSTIVDLTEISKAQKESGIVEKVNIEELIEDIKFSISATVKSSQAEILLNLNTRIFHFSKSNIKSILYNLIINSIKYRHPARLPVITVKSYSLDQTVVIEVEDNGLGIAPQHMNKLFSMFRRFHTHVEGSGVGLYIIKRMIENAGGRIEVQSEVEKGTKFTVFLNEAL